MATPGKRGVGGERDWRGPLQAAAAPAGAKRTWSSRAQPDLRPLRAGLAGSADHSPLAGSGHTKTPSRGCATSISRGGNAWPTRPSAAPRRCRLQGGARTNAPSNSASRRGGVRAGVCASRRRALRLDRVCPRGNKDAATPDGFAEVRQCARLNPAFRFTRPCRLRVRDRHPNGPRRAKRRGGVTAP